MENQDLIATTPRLTAEGKPFNHYVEEQVRNGNLTLDKIPAQILGTPRDLEIYRAIRKSNLIADWENKASIGDNKCRT